MPSTVNNSIRNPITDTRPEDVLIGALAMIQQDIENDVATLVEHQILLIQTALNSYRRGMLAQEEIRAEHRVIWENYLTEKEALRTGFRRYGRHTSNCQIRMSSDSTIFVLDRDCSCGFRDAVRRFL